MSHFQPCEKRRWPAPMPGLGTAALLGLTLLAAAPSRAQKVQIIEPEVKPAPAAQNVRPFDDGPVPTPEQAAALKRDYELLQAAYAGETYNVRNALAKGANIEVRDTQYGFTPLMLAASKGHLGTVRYLIGKGAKVNAHSRVGQSMPVANGKTATTTAVAQPGQLGQMNSMPVLMSESGGLSPLHLASAGGYNLTVRELLAHGANANDRSPDGDTPLMYAAFKGYLPSVQALLARGADVNAIDRHRSTSLDLAAWQGHLPVVRLLLERGAKVNVRNTGGWTAITFAQAGGNTAITRLLKQESARQAKWEAAHPSTPVNTAGTPNGVHRSPVPAQESINDGSIIIVR